MQKFTGRSALVRGDRRGLLDRILDTPQLAQVVPRLPPELLHRVIERCGLEDCGELVALATPAQVARVLDLDLWRSPSAGLDEQFDADRFGVWIEVLVEQGADVAARTVAGLDADLVAAGLAQHVRIFHIATLDGYVTTDGTEIPAVIEPDGGLACEIAGSRIIARRPDAWDAIVDVLAELDASHPAAFARMMRACLALSNSRSELDGLDALLSGADQAMFDLADEREQRREALGFASPAQARAFLESSRRLRLDAAAPPVASLRARAQAAGRDPAPDHPTTSTAAVIDLLREAGLVPDPPRGLLAAARQEELAALANVLVAGCTIDAPPVHAAGGIGRRARHLQPGARVLAGAVARRRDGVRRRARRARPRHGVPGRVDGAARRRLRAHGEPAARRAGRPARARPRDAGGARCPAA